MLKLENISLILGKKSQLERQLFQDLSFSIHTGEFVVLIGDNGAGKSTLFDLIGGYMKPDRGSIFIDHEDVTFTAQHDRAIDVSKVMQDPKVGTMEQMTIEENMSFAYLRGQKRGLTPHQNKARRQLFADKLALLGMGLENRLDDFVGNLSGGQRQALSLIMAIVAKSKILLLDEITAALDPKIADNVMKIAAHVIAEEKLTTMMVTHNMHHALQYGERTLLLSQGKIIKEFSRREKDSLMPQELIAEFGRAYN